MIQLEIKDNLIVSDSNFITADSKIQMYGIVAVSGSSDSIEKVAANFNEKIPNGCSSLSSFENWMNDPENQNKILSILTSLYLDSNRCSFHCYISDHTFSKFLFVMRTLLPELNLGDTLVQKEIETLYIDFDKTLLLFDSASINKDMISKVLSFIDQESKIKKLNGLCELLSKTTFNIDKIEKNLTLLSTADLSLFDYANYSHMLFILLPKFGDKVVWASEHSLVGLKFCKDTVSQVLKQGKNEFELKKICIDESDSIVMFIRRLMLLFHYSWNHFHEVEKINILNENERLIIVIIWMLFQSSNSGWMITTEDFDKLKQLLDN